jgi:hypothetical protein
VNEAEVVFRASRKKAALVLAGSLCFVALGLWLSTEKPLIGWTCVALFSLGVPASSLMMRPNFMLLRLDPQGFEMVSFKRRHKILWTDVDAFRIASIRGAKMIAITYRQDYAEHRASRAVAAMLSGMQGAIPNSYDAPLEEVARTLNEWRERYRGTQA